MKDFAKQTTLGIVLGLLVCGIAAGTAPSCAHVGPILTCFGENVNSGDILRVQEDYRTRNIQDLIIFAAQKGWPLFDCISDEIARKNPELAPAVKEFRKSTEYKGAKPEASKLYMPVPGDGPGTAPQRGPAATSLAPIQTVFCYSTNPPTCEPFPAPVVDAITPAPTVETWDGWLTLDWAALDIAWPAPPARI